MQSLDIAIETLQAFFDDAWDAATDAANSFRAQLRTYESAITKQFSTVGTLGSVSKNSASQSYRGPGLGQYTVAQIQTAWRMLINLYDQFKVKTDWLNLNEVWFQEKYPTYAADPDEAIYDLVSCWLRNDFTSYEIDVTNLRLRPTLGERTRTW